jgi:tagatose-6-phosphate ketose/aldose isomerase
VQAELGIDCQAIGGGVQLTGKTEALPVCRPRMMVSLARSGDSPESTGALSLMLEHDPEMCHLVLTCNSTGALAQTYRGHTQVSVVTLGDNTNDQSLVMTSSFTNLIVAARFLGLVNHPDVYRDICDQAASIAAQYSRRSLTPWRKLQNQVSNESFTWAVMAPLARRL